MHIVCHIRGKRFSASALTKRSRSRQGGKHLLRATFLCTPSLRPSTARGKLWHMVASFPSPRRWVVGNLHTRSGRAHVCCCFSSHLLCFIKETCGWIAESCVQSFKEAQSIEDKRKALIDRGRTLLGWPYLWGGRSAYMPNLSVCKAQISGVDCSGLFFHLMTWSNIAMTRNDVLGLVGLLYRSIGQLLPRDANPMFIDSKPVSQASDLLAGDLFFFSLAREPPHM